MCMTAPAQGLQLHTSIAFKRFTDHLLNSGACRKWSFLTAAPLTIPARTNVTLHCGSREVWLHSKQGPITLGAQAALTLHGCHVMLFRNAAEESRHVSLSEEPLGPLDASAGATLTLVDSTVFAQHAVRNPLHFLTGLSNHTHVGLQLAHASAALAQITYTAVA
jgi:hypothetical protein